MKRIIQFSRGFLPAAIISGLLILSGIIGYFALGGFNLGVDFRAGLIQEVQFAPTAFSITWKGTANAVVSYDRNGIALTLSGAGIEGVTHNFSFSEYPNMGALTSAMGRVEGISVSLSAPANAQSNALIENAHSDPMLGDSPYVFHYLPPNLPSITIEEVRSSLESLGRVSVQVLGSPAERRFMIRMDDSEVESEGGVSAEKIIGALEARFGEGGVAVTRSDYVGSRFSQGLTSQTMVLLLATLLLILVYSSIRFKIQYALGAVLAIAHDALIMVAFLTLTRMEFNTTTIAAILTILGYSINDTIVIFDRIREDRRIHPEEAFVQILNRSISETLSRTIITTFTTMLAVLSLFIFTTGSMKDFALILLVGMTSGVYSTIYIACGFVNFWDKVGPKRKDRREPAPVAGAESV